VLIVGAGPVGLTAALALAQADIPVRVVDAGPDVDKRMRASTFHPPTLDMLETLGLASDLVSQGLPVSRFQLRQHESGDHVVFDLSDISDATSHPYRLQVEQHRYCALAVESLSRSGIDVEFNTRVESVIQSADEVTAILQNGEIHALWLIGADGATSLIRRRLLGPIPPGRLAIAAGWNCVCAAAMDVTLHRNKRIEIHDVACAMHAGTVINPAIVTSQVQGGFLYGLCAALWGDIEIQNGQVLAGNFDSQPVLRMNQAPAVRVQLVPGDEPPGGVGELPTSVAAPALANAIAAAGGERLRELPVQRAGYQLKT